MILTQLAARSRFHHHSPHHIQTVPRPLHPLYLNYPFPNYPLAGVPSYSHPLLVKYVFYDYILHSTECQS